MKQLIWLSLFLWVFGCGSHKHCQKLPQLNIPSKIRTLSKDYKLAPDTWNTHLQLVYHLQQHAFTLRNQAVEAIFTLIKDNTKSFFLPALVDPEEKMAMIEVAVRETYLKDVTSYQLTQKQCKQISYHWKQLIKAEYYLICSTIVTAELKQKWHIFTQKCHHLEPFVTLQTSLNDLSSVALLEQKKEQMNTLLNACQQLAISNENVEIPTWEYDFTQD